MDICSSTYTPRFLTTVVEAHYCLIGLPTFDFSIPEQTIEGPRGTGGTKRQSAEGVGSGEGRRSPSRKIFEISVAKSRIVMHFASNITESVSLKIFSFWLLVTLVNNVISYLNHIIIVYSSIVVLQQAVGTEKPNKDMGILILLKQQCICPIVTNIC